jgi:hypothetical protein
VEVEGSLDHFDEGIRTGKCRVVSDGSYKDGCGSASVVLEHKETGERICVDCIVPGPTGSQSSCRSELSGFHSVTFFITVLLEHFHGSEALQVTGGIEAGCDGESALGCCFDRNVFERARSSDFDSIIAVRRRLARFPKLLWQSAQRSNCLFSWWLWHRLRTARGDICPRDAPRQRILH